MADLEFERRDGYAVMTFNRPQHRNALTTPMAQEMGRLLLEIEKDSSLRCLILRGAGDHFMAGGDVKGFTETLEMSSEERRLNFERRVQDCAPIFHALNRIPQIVLASVRGAVAGAGVSFTAAADLAIASPTAFFLMAQIHLGMSPDGTATYFLPRLVGLKRAKEIALLGDRFDAQQAERWGMLNRVVDNDAELDDVVEAMARRLAKGPATALGKTKQLLNASQQNDFEVQFQAEAVSFGTCAATDDFAEGVRAFFDKRKPEFGKKS